MTKKVSIRITGSQKDIDGCGNDRIETSAVGKYCEKDGFENIVYFEEDEDDSSRSTKCTLRFNGSKLCMMRSGVINSELVFEPGHQNTCSYVMPFGEFEMMTDTKALDIKKESDRITILLSYILSVNGSPTSENRTEITVESCFPEIF